MPAHRRVTCFRHKEQRQHYPYCTDWQVDQEEPAPVKGLDQKATDDRAKRSAHAPHRSPDADSGTALLGREDDHHNRQAHRRQSSCANSLKGAETDQPAHRGRTTDTSACLRESAAEGTGKMNISVRMNNCKFAFVSLMAIHH